MLNITTSTNNLDSMSVCIMVELIYSFTRVYGCWWSVVDADRTVLLRRPICVHNAPKF